MRYECGPIIRGYSLWTSEDETLIKKTCRTHSRPTKTEKKTEKKIQFSKCLTVNVSRFRLAAVDRHQTTWRKSAVKTAGRNVKSIKSVPVKHVSAY